MIPASKNRVLVGILRQKQDAIMGVCRKEINEDLHNPYYSPKAKLKVLRCAEHSGGRGDEVMQMFCETDLSKESTKKN
jgi:hypothetical protein